MKQALENATDEDRAAINEMLGDLNELLEKHRRGEDTQEDFDEFMAKHGDFFPENPQNIDELLDALAQRAAAAQRMLNSMTRRAARGADAALRAGVRLAGADGVARPGSTPTCRRCGPARTGAAPSGSTASRGSASATAPACSRTSPTSTSSPSSSRSPTAAPGWTTSTSTSWPASSATRPPSTPAPCSELEQALRDTGTLRARLRRPAAADPEGDAPARQGAAARRRRADVRPAGPARAAPGRRRRRACPGRPASGRSATPSRGTSRARSLNGVRPPAPRARPVAAGVRSTIEDVEVAGDRGAHPGRASRCSSTRRSRWRWTAAGCR